jgi:hypothetical protein
VTSELPPGTAAMTSTTASDAVRLRHRPHRCVDAQEEDDISDLSGRTTIVVALAGAWGVRSLARSPEARAPVVAVAQPAPGGSYHLLGDER